MIQANLLRLLAGSSAVSLGRHDLADKEPLRDTVSSLYYRSRGEIVFPT